LNQISTLTFDFAVISNPTYLHAKSIDQLIERRIPLFIEKPIFESVDYDLLINKIKYSKVKTYVACNLRFLESIQYMKSIVGAHRINEVTIYCGSYLPEWRKNVDYKESYSAKTESGGGVDLDLIHEIDYAYWLFGTPEKVTKFTSSKSSLEIQSYDCAHYYFSYPNFNLSISLNYYRREPKRTLEVVCEDGTFLVDLIKNKIDFKGEKLVSFESTIIDTYKTQLSFFIDKILKGKEIFNDAEEAYKILKICQYQN
jgi:predicted dehydrogenase